MLTKDPAYEYLTNVTVATCITRARGIFVEVPLVPEDQLPEPCVANLDSVLTVGESCINERISRLSPEKMGAIEEAPAFALALPG
jgi:mRNA-degrading endonuclease toxin of MazEF toxin-antitoxin module